MIVMSVWLLPSVVSKGWSWSCLPCGTCCFVAFVAWQKAGSWNVASAFPRKLHLHTRPDMITIRPRPRHPTWCFLGILWCILSLHLRLITVGNAPWKSWPGGDTGAGVPAFFLCLGQQPMHLQEKWLMKLVDPVDPCRGAAGRQWGRKKCQHADWKVFLEMGQNTKEMGIWWKMMTCGDGPKPINTIFP